MASSVPPDLPPLLQQAWAEAQPLIRTRGWQPPAEAAWADAARLLALVAPWPAPTVSVDPEGAVLLEWEQDPRGWLQLSVRGDGQLVHSAVLDGDDYGQSEPFVATQPPTLPDWAATLLTRLWDPPANERVHH